MRYGEIGIETQRQSPARARTEGEALLRRAGYLGRDRELTPLGRRTHARLEELAQTRPAAQVFAALDLPVVTAVAGQFFLPIPQGDLELVHCASCGYAAPLPMASFKKPIPAEEAIQPIEKVLTPECHTIAALAHFLEIPEAKTAKALMYTRTTDCKFVFVVVRGDMQLSDEKLRRCAGDLRAATSDEIIARGAVPGYASPIGLKNALVAVDDLITQAPNLVAGANEPGYHLKNTNYARDYQADIVADLVLAEAGAPCVNCGSPLAIEKADLMADSDGYCLERLLEDLAQAHHDSKGLTLPPVAAPFDVYLLHLPAKEMDTHAQAVQLYEDWQKAGVSVLLDDRNERAGVKFADADLIGCPLRATVGERGMKDGMVELKTRQGTDSMSVPFGTALDSIRSLTQRVS